MTGEGPPDSPPADSGDADLSSGDRPSEARLDVLRAHIVELDDELIRMVGRRLALVLEVAREKERLGLPVLDPPREARVVRRAAERARELGVDQELVRDVIWRIIAAAREVQEKRTGWGPPPLPGPEGEAP